MTRPLAEALGELEAELRDPDTLVRAVAAGRRRTGHPRWRRVELRYVDLKAGRRLQVTAYDATQAHTSNHSTDEAPAVIAELLAEPFGHWHVDTAVHTRQLRVTKKGDAVVSVSRRAAAALVERHHDRAKKRLLSAYDPLLRALGITDGEGRVRPGKADKFRQVEEFARQLVATLTDARGAGALREPSPDQPLRVVDLGAGNAYLTFVAHRLLTAELGWPVHLTGVDVKEQSLRHNRGVAAELGVALDFVQAGIADYRPEQPPEVVLALHACDTATDDALARAVAWRAPVVLAAPCCHHDVAVQLRAAPAPPPYALLTRYGILRERFADTLTDALRASLVRQQGYRVDVVEFVASAHTPRNTLLRAVRTGALDQGGTAPSREYAELVAAWGLKPRLGELLGAEAGVVGESGGAGACEVR